MVPEVPIPTSGLAGLASSDEVSCWQALAAVQCSQDRRRTVILTVYISLYGFSPFPYKAVRIQSWGSTLMMQSNLITFQWSYFQTLIIRCDTQVSLSTINIRFSWLNSWVWGDKYSDRSSCALSLVPPHPHLSLSFTVCATMLLSAYLFWCPCLMWCFRQSPWSRTSNPMIHKVFRF